MSTLTHKTTTGILWTLAEQFAVRGVTVLVTLVLAWFLSPEDFGLVAMMAVFIAIATSLMDSGFKQALIRLPEARSEDFNTAFYANLLLGGIAYCLLFLAAPLIADFYSESRLVSLIRVAGVVVVINAFQIVQVAQLSRNLDFKAQFRAALPASLVSAVVAVIMAARGFGVWALITQMIVSASTLTFLLWWQGGWRPGISVSSDSLRQMYGFGYKLFLSGLLDTGFKNMYVIVIAKLFSTSLAGLYFFADRIREMVIFQLVSAIQKVTYPALSTIQSDSLRMKESYRKLVRIASFILFPIILFIGALAEPIFELLLPEKWWPAAVYLQLMCLAGVLIPIHAINLNILKVLGRSDLFLGLELIKKAMAVAILAISYRYGIIGILIGQVATSILGYIPNSYYSKKLINYGIKEQLADFMPALFLASGVGVVAWAGQKMLPWHDLTKLMVLGVACLIVYLLCGRLLRIKALGDAKDLVTR
jgi:O-antigen/teichoic acid export membrane protein